MWRRRSARSSAAEVAAVADNIGTSMFQAINTIYNNTGTIGE